MASKHSRDKKSTSGRRGMNGSRKATDTISLADEIIRIGRSVPLSEWDKLPSDYFANLEAYRSAKPGAK